MDASIIPEADAEFDEEALHMAAYEGDITDVVRLLRDERVKRLNLLQAEDEIGETPLWIAVDEKRPDVVRALLHAGADPNAENGDGKTVLHMVSRRGHKAELFRALLRFGADPNAADKQGKTPLHLACWSRLVTNVNVLLAAGANPGAKDKSGKTPLHWAFGGGAASKRAWQAVFDSNYGNDGRVEVLRALIVAGADVDAADTDGKTPLHSACTVGHLESVEVLLAADAQRAPKDADDQTPLDCVKGVNRRTESLFNRYLGGAAARRLCTCDRGAAGVQS